MLWLLLLLVGCHAPCKLLLTLLLLHVCVLPLIHPLLSYLWPTAPRWSWPRHGRGSWPRATELAFTCATNPSISLHSASLELPEARAGELARITELAGKAGVASLASLDAHIKLLQVGGGVAAGGCGMHGRLAGMHARPACAVCDCSACLRRPARAYQAPPPPDPPIPALFVDGAACRL